MHFQLCDSCVHGYQIYSKGNIANRIVVTEYMHKYSIVSRPLTFLPSRPCEVARKLSMRDRESSKLGCLVVVNGLHIAVMNMSLNSQFGSEILAPSVSLMTLSPFTS